jgi:hypothetical protein
MNMRMIHEVLTPGMQNRDEPDLGSEALSVLRELRQGFRNSLKQDGVEDFLISKDKRVQEVGDGEDDMEVRDRKKILFSIFDPPLFFEELTLGAVPVSAGVVRDELRAAMTALVHVTALLCGAAGLDRPHGA